MAKDEWDKATRLIGAAIEILAQESPMTAAMWQKIVAPQTGA